MKRNANYDFATEVLIRDRAVRKQRACGYRIIRRDDLIERAYLSKATCLIVGGRCYEVGIAGNYVKAYVNYLSELVYLAVRTEKHLIRKSECTLIRNLNVTNLGISGLPVIVAEYGTCISALRIIPICIVIRPIHTYVKVSGLDNISLARYGIGEPSVGCTEKHRKAKQERNNAVK